MMRGASSSPSAPSGVQTRGQKRRIGQSDVWDLIVNNDDICFKHILRRLNSNDVKFLYGVNTETRKLIKRSSRESDLKKKLKVREILRGTWSRITSMCVSNTSFRD